MHVNAYLSLDGSHLHFAFRLIIDDFYLKDNENLNKGRS